MALTNNTLPSNLPTIAVPYDALLAWPSQTLTATGYMQIASANGQLDLKPGRLVGYWCFDISALTISSNQTYALYLLASNDSAFGNANVEQLASYDLAAASSGRRIATILPATGTTPPTGLTASRYVIPYTNMIGQYVFRYVQMYLVIGGTSPSITLTSWLTYDTDS